MDKWISRIRGIRKWSVMVIIIVIGVGFRICDLLTGVEFVALIKGVAVAFMASNAIERAKDAIVSRFGKKEDMSDD